MQRSKRRLLVVAAAAAVIPQLGFYNAAHAANVTWDGGGADNSLGTFANWSTDTLPAATDNVYFAGNVRTTPNAAAPAQYLALFFAAGAAPFNLTGAGPITLGSTTVGNYLNNDDVGVAQTIAAPINMIGGTVNATQGDLVLAGQFNVGNGSNTTSGNNVTLFAGLGNMTLSGGITGTGTDSSAGGSITKTGTGNLVVTASSPAWTGNVFVNGGNLRITNADALGAGPGRIETALTSGGTGLGTLELDGSAGGFTLAKPVTTRARQGTTINEVSIRNVAGNNTISTVNTDTGGSQFNYESAGGNLTIDTWSTVKAGGGRALRLLGAGSGQINNWAPNTGGNVITVIKDGAGTWTLGPGMNVGDATQVFGPITVNGGNLVLAPGLGAKVVGSATVAPNVTVNNGGTLTVQAANGVDGEVGNAPTPNDPAGIVTVKAGGTLDASSFSVYNLQATQVLIGGGTIKAGTLGAFGDNAIHVGDSDASTAVGTLTVQGNLSLTHAFATATGGLYFDLGNATTPGGGVNDLVSVQGDLQVDTSSGPIDVRLTPLASGLTTGTYRLIDYTSGTTLDPSDFNLIGFTPGTTRQSASITTAAGQVNLSVAGSPASLVWKGDGSANVWDSAGTANFLNGATPDKFFPFDNATFDDTSANKTVSLSGSLVLGSATVNTASTYTFTGSGSLDGGGTLTKSGSGTLIVANTGPNTYSGGTTINAGTLQVGNGGADGSLGTGPVVDNGTLAYNKSGAETIGGVLSGSGSLVQQGSGTLVLAANNTYAGATTVNGGTLQVGNGGTAGWFGAGPVTTNANLAFNRSDNVSYAGVIAGSGGITQAGGGTLELTGANTYAGTTAVNAGTLRATIGAGIPSASNLSLGGGILQVTNASISRAYGTGPGQFQFNGGNTGFATDGADLAVTITNGGAPIPANFATLILNTAASTNGITFSADMDLTGANRFVTSNGAAGVTNTLSGVLSGTGGLRVDGPAPLVLTTGSTFTGGAIIDSGPQELTVVRAVASNALGTGSVTLGEGGNASQARLELLGGIVLPNNIGFNGRNNDSVGIQNIGGDNAITGRLSLNPGGNRYWIQSDAGSLTLTGAADASGIAIAAGSGSRTVTFQGNGNGRVSGIIDNGGGTVAVTKAGAGTWTLSGANTYTGATTVSGGRLVLTPAAYAPVTSGAGGAIVNAGRLVFDYTGSTSPAGAVVPLLTSAAASNFSTGQIRSAATDGTHTLGYYDDGVSTLTVMYTYYGDLNLDGRVNADDYALLDRGRAKGLTGWVNGDVNYDGSVTSADYLLTDTAFGQQNGTLSPAFLAMRESQFGDAYVAQLIAAVPEPASFSLLTLAVAPLVSRRRRK